MRVGFDKLSISTYKNLVREANKALRKKSRIKKDKYEKALANKNISVENKKRQDEGNGDDYC